VLSYSTAQTLREEEEDKKISGQYLFKDPQEQSDKKEIQ